jgi:hypothetical protein
MDSTGSDDTEELLEAAPTDDTAEGGRDGYAYSLQEREDLYLITFSRFNLEIIIDINTGNTLIGKECEEGKVCRGMTAEEVEQIVGIPASVDVSTNEAWFKGHFTEWEWDDAGKTYVWTEPAIGIPPVWNEETKTWEGGGYEDVEEAEGVVDGWVEDEGDICAEGVTWGCDMKFQSIQLGGKRFLILIELNDINGKYIDVTQF